MRQTDQGIEGRWQDVSIHSSFASVALSLADGTHAYRAITTARMNDSKLDEDELFSLAKDGQELVGLDRLVRTVHLLNFLTCYPPENRLFLRVQEGLFTCVSSNYGSAFRKMMNSLGVPSSRIVLELPIQLSADPPRVSLIAQSYHINGFEICVQTSSIEMLTKLAETIPIDYGRVVDAPDHIVITKRASGPGDR